ncbi:4-hydroxy-2-oxoheptanedioate aldolase [Salinicola endophyticus]|uniref:4-hydroxy-2-oxoheptanedioate aldolase n=1 Tax=Salinicola endophyticus TaxID=1949083 RepID=A0ABY8FJI1_9GAMM|nr:4-hydroxy-2-oxoheptanedioate aldolase [Salinicola endophyticus]WFF41346.1 4-hydroxy-2-oxoheptanedioate aldolase [Salinicola endophyticus]
MEMPINTFKQALGRKDAQIGLWLGLANGYCAELAANAGFDWLLIDGEHAPNDLRTILAQLQAMAPYPVHPVARPPMGDAATIKQYLDIGVQTLLVPMVDTARQARDLVRATRYPPDGIRGVGSALARASRWNSIPGYLDHADEEICLLVQIESRQGLENLDEIADVDGVDGVFIGPADLSASLGHRGNPGHTEVQAAIEDGIARIQTAGKAAGILSANKPLARRYLELGASFVAVGVDTSVLMNALTALAGEFRGDASPAAAAPSVY